MYLAFYNIVQWDFSDSHATQPTVHAGCFSVSIIHQTLTWTTGSLTCAQMCTWGCTDTVRESARKVYSGRKIPCRTGESNLRRQRAGPMLYQLSYIPCTRSLNLLDVFFRPTHTLVLIQCCKVSSSVFDYNFELTAVLIA